MDGKIICGRLAPGLGQGRHFTQLEWARNQFISKLSIDPFPGTVNIVVDNDYLQTWHDLRATPGISVINPDSASGSCGARCYSVLIEQRYEAAIVLPEITGYAPGLIELITATPIRKTLALTDGDILQLTIK